jgi:hypothetical protein
MTSTERFMCACCFETITERAADDYYDMCRPCYERAADDLLDAMAQAKLNPLHAAMEAIVEKGLKFAKGGTL